MTYSRSNLDSQDSSESSLSRTAESTKAHVIQLEVLSLTVIFFATLLFLQPAVSQLVSPDYGFLLPFPFLAFLPALMPVVNPVSKLRAILKYGLSGLGTGATLGGGITGTLTGGLGAPAGALIGAGVGFFAGASYGAFYGDVDKEVLTQGQAREYLISKRRKHPALALEAIVAATEEFALDPSCHIYMFRSDGTLKCTKDDVTKWVESECWKRST